MADKTGGETSETEKKDEEVFDWAEIEKLVENIDKLNKNLDALMVFLDDLTLAIRQGR